MRALREKTYVVGGGPPPPPGPAAPASLAPPPIARATSQVFRPINTVSIVAQYAAHRVLHIHG